MFKVKSVYKIEVDGGKLYVSFRTELLTVDQRSELLSSFAAVKLALPIGAIGMS